jgi:hypothetical protein
MADKYAGPEEAYMATDAENQNNALRMGADNSINDPNWNKMKYKKERIRDFVPKEKVQSTKLSKKNVRKSYAE